MFVHAASLFLSVYLESRFATASVKVNSNVDISDRATSQMVILGSSKWYFSKVLESVVFGDIPSQVILKSGIRI